MGRLLSIKQVAEVCAVQQKTVRGWIARGEIDSVKVGRNRRVPESALRTRVIRGFEPKGLR